MSTCMSKRSGHNTDRVDARIVLGVPYAWHGCELSGIGRTPTARMQLKIDKGGLYADLACYAVPRCWVRTACGSRAGYKSAADGLRDPGALLHYTAQPVTISGKGKKRHGEVECSPDRWKCPSVAFRSPQSSLVTELPKDLENTDPPSRTL